MSRAPWTSMSSSDVFSAPEPREDLDLAGGAVSPAVNEVVLEEGAPRRHPPEDGVRDEEVLATVHSRRRVGRRRVGDGEPQRRARRGPRAAAG